MPRVLVIDDDSSVLRSFQLSLENLPCDVEVASGGEAALQMLAEQGTPDLIFLDLKMRELDGVETLWKLSAAGHTCPVFLITAFAEEFTERLTSAVDFGLKFELARKPLEQHEIRRIVKIALGFETEAHKPTPTGPSGGASESR